MAVNDLIADFLTRVRNAAHAEKTYVDVLWSKLTQNIAQILKDNGYIAHFLVKEEDKKKKMRLFLRYLPNRKPLIRGLKRLSKPGHRKYVGCDAVPKVFNGLGIAIVSTSKGVLIGSEARAKRAGGELLCCVW